MGHKESIADPSVQWPWNRDGHLGTGVHPTFVYTAEANAIVETDHLEQEIAAGH